PHTRPPPSPDTSPSTGRTAVGVQVYCAPLVQRLAVPPGLGDARANAGRRDPGLDRPTFPADQPLVAQQVRSRVVLRVRRRDALELLAFHLITLLTQIGDNRNELLA